jgi:hypothetical protein
MLNVASVVLAANTDTFRHRFDDVAHHFFGNMQPRSVQLCFQHFKAGFRTRFARGLLCEQLRRLAQTFTYCFQTIGALLAKYETKWFSCKNHL